MLDCHDREAVAHVAAPRHLSAADIQELYHPAVKARFGAGLASRTEILSDNGSIYTALQTLITAGQLGLIAITTSVRSPEPNGMSEAFVKYLRRDYIEGADLSSAAGVLAQIDGWVEYYNSVVRHSALKMYSPRKYRAETSLPAP